MTTTSQTDRPGCDTSDMIHIHQVFRRAFVDAPVLVRGVAAGDRARAAVVGAHVREMADVLHGHHRGEDLILWDKLEERSPACALHVGLMRSQHATVGTLLERLHTVLPGWEGSASAEDREAVAEVLDEIRAALLTHLGMEEDRILPAASSVLSQREWDQLGEHGRAAVPRDRLIVLLGWIVETIPPAQRAEWLRSNLPLPLRAMWLAVGRRKFAAHRARVYGTALAAG
ncbi:hemerythrin domain-containing protein [Actinotalea sp. Marseille-Q4924]|uniref:hemerythrin domain-containing protein n=1 Tax=Actinotalea sp. Marseille-Q4924 TaxID=2866571 RepID=UPI001CE3E73B|nr:hemerythrin domain-containing protein [Actinotalea sp. Marseille-Q4924]